jgi:hypothetical protein
MYKIKAWLSPLLKFVTHHEGMGAVFINKEHACQ